MLLNQRKSATLGSEQQIVEAKDALWDFCGTATLGEKIKIKSTASRSEMEAHTIDIWNAIIKRDKSGKFPLTVIDASSLGVIPRSHPEELNNISLCDRLNQVESRMEKMQVLLDKSLAQYMTLQDKLGSMNSYAVMVNKTSANVFNHTQNTTTASMGVVKQRTVTGSALKPKEAITTSKAVFTGTSSNTYVKTPLTASSKDVPVITEGN